MTLELRSGFWRVFPRELGPSSCPYCQQALWFWGLQLEGGLIRNSQQTHKVY